MCFYCTLSNLSAAAVQKLVAKKEVKTNEGAEVSNSRVGKNAFMSLQEILYLWHEKKNQYKKSNTIIII